MWEDFKPLDTNEQQNFLKGLQRKQRSQDRQVKLVGNVEKIQAQVRRYLSNRRTTTPFVDESTEKVRSILIRRPEYEGDKFCKMMGNALNKMPFFFQTVAFINQHNYKRFQQYLVVLASVLMDDDNRLIHRVVQSSHHRLLLLSKVARLAPNLIEEYPIMLGFLKTFVAQMTKLSNSQLVFQTLVTQNNFTALWRAISRRQLGGQIKDIVCRQMVKKQLRDTSLDYLGFLNLFLLDRDITVGSLPELTQISLRIRSEDSKTIDLLKMESRLQLHQMYVVSLQLLCSIGNTDPLENTNQLLMSHRYVLYAYSGKEIQDIKKQLYRRNIVTQTDQNKEEIRDRVRLTTKYTQLISTVLSHGYFNQLFQFFNCLLDHSPPENQVEVYRACLDNACLIYIKLFNLLEIQQLGVLCSRQFILTLENYISRNKIKFNFIDEHSPIAKVIYIYTAAISKLFQNMDDFEFVNPQMSFPKEAIIAQVRSTYKLLVSIINKKNQSELLRDIYKHTTTFLATVYAKNSRTLYFDNKVFSGENALGDNNYSMLKVSGIQKHIHRLPFIVPFNVRYENFKDQLYQYKGYGNNHGIDVQIRRGYELEDAYRQLQNYPLAKRFNVTFISQSGVKELGVDAGGLTKEFVNRVIKDAFNPARGLFVETISREMIPNPACKDKDEYYEFVGRLVAKAILDSILVPVKLSSCFINLILGRKNTIEDLRFIDKEYYTNLMKLKHSDDDVQSLQLTFTYFENGKLELLKQNGNNIVVTKYTTKLQLIRLLSDQKTNKSFQNQSLSFRKGFQRLIPSLQFQKFNYQELNMIISGRSTQFDVQDLKRNTLYMGYSVHDDNIKDFWSVVSEISDQEKIQLLKYVTSCSRPPIMGFGELSPKFKIAKQLGDDAESYLPKASTCVNTLYLPEYNDKEVLRKKLLYAIKENQGFGLA